MRAKRSLLVRRLRQRFTLSISFEEEKLIPLPEGFNFYGDRFIANKADDQINVPYTSSNDILIDHEPPLLKKRNRLGRHGLLKGFTELAISGLLK